MKARREFISYCKNKLLFYTAIPSCSAKIEGLVHYPTTIAPNSGSRIVVTQCADNAHIRSGSSLNTMCVSNGNWSGLIPQCECDDGYWPTMVHDKLICKG